MNLIWHIARKDARLIAVPLACWLVSFPAVALWVRFAPTTTNIWPWDDLSAWLGAMGTLTGAIGWVQLVVGGVLVGRIFQEDPSGGTTVFWRTRPVAAWRLVAGKIAAVLVCTVIAPVVVLLPVWVGSGFSAVDVLEAAWDCAKWQVVAAWLAMIAASLTGNLVQFLFVALGVGVSAGLAIGGHETWERIAVGLCFVGGLVVLEEAWHRRRVRTAWGVTGVVMAVLLVGRFWISDPKRAVRESVPQVGLVASPELRARLGEAAMRALEERVAKIRSEAPHVAVRPWIIGECALREGEVFRNGAARLHILAAIEYGGRGGPREFALRIEERDTWRSWRERSFRNEVRSISGDDDHITRLVATRGEPTVGRSFEDVYLVVLPSSGAAAVMSESVRVTMVRYSILRSVAAPTCALPLRDAQGREIHSLMNDREAVLVKVRLEKTPSSTP